MKKLGILILGIIIGALAMYFYFHNDQNNSDMGQIPQPEGLINPTEIQTLTQAYNDRYNTVTDTYFKGVVGGDNRSSWYALEDLENFLALAKKEATDLGYTMDGVRLYLGAHPLVDGIPGYTTILFVPTGYENTSEGNLVKTGLKKGGNDIGGANGLDKGSDGVPPSANYPQ